MALTRKMLRAMGIEDEKIEQIIEAHTETVDALKQYKDDADKLKEVQKELDELKAQNGDSYKKKFDDLKAEYDQYKNEQTAKAEKDAKRVAYRAMLKEAGVNEKRIDTVLKVVDFNDVKLDKDGSLKDKDTLINAVKTEWADFIVTKTQEGAETPTPPNSNGVKMSKADILKISDTTARQKAISENIELFQ